MQQTSKLEKSFENHGSEFLVGIVGGFDPVGIAIGAVCKKAKKDIKTFTYELYNKSHHLHPIKLIGGFCGIAFIYENPEIGVCIGTSIRIFDACGNYVRKKREAHSAR